MTVSLLASPSKAPRSHFTGTKSSDDVSKTSPTHIYRYTYTLLRSLAFFVCVSIMIIHIVVGINLREPHTSEFFIYRYITCGMYCACLFDCNLWAKTARRDAWKE